MSRLPLFATLVLAGTWWSSALITTLPARGETPENAAAAVARLRSLDLNLFDQQTAESLASGWRDNVTARRAAANARSTAAWRAIENKQQWETYRDARLADLRRALGESPAPPARLQVHHVGELSGDGYRLQKLLFETRPGLWATAHLYLPAEPRRSMPGLLICHSHHRPKQQGELQDMGMTWARGGCAVLVMDQLGHGERGEHPFRRESDFPREFRVSRQDYWFRYDNGMQLHLAGESLAGWMAWDLQRGIDLLLAQENIDQDRIILLGAVAGGGDPSAVAAALDPRITCVVPFNFGGPQGYSPYPLPADAADTFNYSGGGSWESTRNLTRSSADGFLPWLIVAASAPRRLIYAHEFQWDHERDPVWARLQQVYRWYDASEDLAFVHGRGSVKLRPPAATHCTHIGPPHRAMIHPIFHNWFGIPVTAEDEYSARREDDQMLVMTPEWRKRLRPRPLCELVEELASGRSAAAAQQLKDKSPAEQRQWLRAAWEKVLGPIEPNPAKLDRQEVSELEGLGTLERFALQTEPGMLIPAALITPAGPGPHPLVVMIAQAGRRKLLDARADEVQQLLAGGAAVCLADLRGSGELSPGTDRGRQTAASALSSEELMLGGTTLGAQLRDLRSLLGHLRGRKNLDARRVAVWGESLRPANDAKTEFIVPHGIDRPAVSEPGAALLALLAALYEEPVIAVGTGGLDRFASAHASPFVYLPHDVIIPGVARTGDLPALVAALAGRPVRLERLVDGWNRPVPVAVIAREYQLARAAQPQGASPDDLALGNSSESIPAWLLSRLQPARQP